MDGPCPLFLFDANCPGTGKSKLCDIIAILAAALEALESDPNSNIELREILLNWSKDARLPSARTVGNHLNKFRGRVVARKMLQFTFRAGRRSWFVQPVQPVVPAHQTQPGGASNASDVSLQPNLEDDLSHVERNEVADLLAEMRPGRNPTRFRATYCGEVIR